MKYLKKGQLNKLKMKMIILYHRNRMSFQHSNLSDCQLMKVVQILMILKIIKVDIKPFKVRIIQISIKTNKIWRYKIRLQIRMDS